MPVASCTVVRCGKTAGFPGPVDLLIASSSISGAQGNPPLCHQNSTLAGASFNSIFFLEIDKMIIKMFMKMQIIYDSLEKKNKNAKL